MIRGLLLSLCMLLAGASLFMSTATAYADAKDDLCKGVTAATGQACSSKGDDTAVSGAVRTTLRILQVIAGIFAIFYLIYAGIKFITSTGSSDGVKSARNTIIYTSVGLVVVLIAEAIIRFVLNRFAP